LKNFGNFCRGDASLIRSEESEVRSHNFAAKSLVLSPKAQVYGAKSSADGRVSFQIQIAAQNEAICRNSQAACLPPQSLSCGQA
jgi:hypothetical protein